jgi:rSAM/selenodomain-associated transferase 1
VFAKDPVPGRVKTRLAAVVGDRKAARIYRDMARGIVNGLRGGAFRVRVCFDPPGNEAAVKAWMDPGNLEFQPQVSGDLGIRLESAIRRGLEEAEAVMVIGTDAPGVDRCLVEEAFAELAHSDLVLGPTEDGGYYLLGLKEPTPSLFRDIPWSTAGVLHATRNRAEALGLVIRELPLLRDVDTVEDLEVLGVRGPEGD